MFPSWFYAFEISAMLFWFSVAQNLLCAVFSAARFNRVGQFFCASKSAQVKRCATYHGMCLSTPVRISRAATRAKITAQVSREILGRFVATSSLVSVLFSVVAIRIALLRFL
jgi:hypothetical protein